MSFSSDNHGDTMQQQHPTESHPAPIFSNQKANLSALSASLSAFSQKLQQEARALRLGCQEEDCSSAAANNTQQVAEKFLNTQHDRLTYVEESLLHGTEYILPIDSQRMTVTELAQTCAALHHNNLRKMQQLDGMLRRIIHNDENHPPAYDLRDWEACYWQQNNSNDAAVQQQQNSYTTATTPSWQSVPPLQPLEQVVETDNETDGTVTPGSAYFFSPSEQGTPATPPALASLHLSANTVSALKQQQSRNSNSSSSGRKSLDAIETWRESRRSVLSAIGDSEMFRQQESRHSSSSSQAGEKKERVFVKHSDSSSSDSGSSEHDSTQDDSAVSRQQQSQQNETIIGYDEASMLLDDETEAGNTVATMLAIGRQRAAKASAMLSSTIRESGEPASGSTSKKHTPAAETEKAGREVWDKHEALAGGTGEAKVWSVDNTSTQTSEHETTKEQEKHVALVVPDSRVSPRSSPAAKVAADPPPMSSQSVHSVKEIIVESSYSENEDESTLGSLTLNETLQSPSMSKKPQDANESVCSTPPLARYRVEADDSSLGVKVVPNERRTTAHAHAANKPKVKDRVSKYNTRFNIPALPVSTAKARPNTNYDDIKSPYVTRRSKKVYRKTPHPKKKAGVSLQEHENDDPNNTTLDLDLDDDDSTSDESSVLRSPFQRQAPSPQAARIAFSERRASGSVHRPSTSPSAHPGRSMSLGSVKSPSQKAPLTAAFVAKHMPNDSKLMESFSMADQSLLSLDDLSKGLSLHRNVKQLHNVTADEYNLAPKVVRMQVTLNEVNAGVDALNHWLANTNSARELSETEVERLLQESFSERKTKSVLTSLCHWRRMSLRTRDGGSAKYFQVNP